MLPDSTTRTALRYQPELMGLRAVAVGLVVLSHWTLSEFPLGEVGRLPLFVLSGYLISGIIWKNNVYWYGAGDWPRRLVIFYTRRFIRIIPPLLHGPRTRGFAPPSNAAPIPKLVPSTPL
jgi:peptidoglycan/LPS O-acetylase OafA/YrhL